MNYTRLPELIKLPIRIKLVPPMIVTMMIREKILVGNIQAMFISIKILGNAASRELCWWNDGVPSVPNYRSLWFVLNQISLTLTKFIEKKHQHLQHQISLIKSTMKYVLIGHLFGAVDVTFSINLVKVRNVWLRTKPNWPTFGSDWNRGSS